ncbi:subtilisin DY [Bacillus phage vB_BcoS-136]|uniref:Subtilisin DY n=1 Tax=Bacillus phage vB_BcoS-136 TaxID=2419619 RepID=A0A3G3BVM5_9CAUD|nr:subtilisin DY [Bacillus phage vB_BcoS-136]AYP68308.1 subtilisin DY [Bacillus phage vB_BcoS-136]
MIHQEVDKVEIIDFYDGEIDWGLKSINVQNAWSKTKGEGVKIAVIDTGVDMNHQDLKDSIVRTINMQTKTRDVTDEFGHGTHVAGLLTGKKTGVAPNSELYVAKVLDANGRGSMANILDGITFAINNNVDILCMSLGVSQKLPLILEQRIIDAYYSGITIVCATGNSNKNEVEYPSFYDKVVAVGGVDKDFKRASFSNFGREMNVVAPSVEILSIYKDGNYARMSGTSMASPIVAGAIALMISNARKNGEDLNPSQVIEKFKSLGKHTMDFGHGFIDLDKLLD